MITYILFEAGEMGMGLVAEIGSVSYNSWLYLPPSCSSVNKIGEFLIEGEKGTCVLGYF